MSKQAAQTAQTAQAAKNAQKAERAAATRAANKAAREAAAQEAQEAAAQEEAEGEYDDADQADSDEEEEEEAEGNPQSMANKLRRARGGYHATRAYSGKQSLNNGDNLAKALAGASPAQAIAAAEAVQNTYDEENTPDLTAKYAGQNPGQMRMNAGNRIRGSVKRGDITAAAAIRIIKSV